MDKLRVGVIGVGGHGRNRHLVPYRRLEDVELVAVADVNQDTARKVGEEFGVAHYVDYKEMLDKEKPDLVSVVTPTGLHARIASDALKAGADVLVDKPAGANLREVMELFNLSREVRKRVMVGYWSRFSPALSYVLSLARDGALGQVYHVSASIVRRRGIPGLPTFIDKSLNGGRGALLDIGCYVIDNALAPLGFPPPRSVSGAIYSKIGVRREEVPLNWGSWDPSKFDLEDYAVALVKFDRFTMSLEVGWAANVSHQGEVTLVRILGDEGGVEMRGTEAITDVTFHGVQAGHVVDVKPHLKKADLPSKW